MKHLPEGRESLKGAPGLFYCLPRMRWAETYVKKGKEGIIMANIYKGTLGLIGNTPLVEVVNIEKELGLKATVLVKL